MKQLSAPVFAFPATPTPTPSSRVVLLHLLWAAVALTAVWFLGRAYESGQVTASTGGAQMVWAQYHATLEMNKGVLQRLNPGRQDD